MKTKIIYINIVNQYGNERIFPACETSKKFIEFIRQKTFDTGHLKILQELGYEIVVNSPKIPNLLKEKK